VFTNPSVPSGKLAHGARVGNRKLALLRIGPAASFVFCTARTLDTGEVQATGNLRRSSRVSARRSVGHHVAHLGVTKWAAGLGVDDVDIDNDHHRICPALLVSLQRFFSRRRCDVIFIKDGFNRLCFSPKEFALIAVAWPYYFFNALLGRD